MHAINPGIGYGQRLESRTQREVSANATVRSVARKTSGALVTSKPPAPLKRAIDKALFAAVESNDIRGINRAMSSGADPNACREDDWTPLQLAVLHGCDRAVKRLTEGGATMRPSGGGGGDDQTAAILRMPPAGALQARRLSEAAPGRRSAANVDVDVNARRLTESGNTVFHIAINNNYPHLIAPLAKAGGECEPINTRNRDGLTPIFLAARANNLSAIKELLLAGARAYPDTYLPDLDSSHYPELLAWVETTLANPFHFSRASPTKCATCGIETRHKCRMCSMVRYCSTECLVGQREAHEADCRKWGATFRRLQRLQGALMTRMRLEDVEKVSGIIQFAMHRHQTAAGPQQDRCSASTNVTTTHTIHFALWQSVASSQEASRSVDLRSVASFVSIGRSMARGSTGRSTPGGGAGGGGGGSIAGTLDSIGGGVPESPTSPVTPFTTHLGTSAS